MKIVVSKSPVAGGSIEKYDEQPCSEAHREVLETIVRAFKPRKEWVVEIKSLQHLAQFVDEYDSICFDLIISSTGYRGILLEIEFNYFN